MIKATVKYNSKLTEIERGFSIPLLDVAQQLVPGMLARIERGVASTGYFAPLGAYSADKPGSGLFWVHASYPQPAGYVVKPTSGDYEGWAGYKSYKAYVQALGGGPRTFSLTGMLLRALAIRVLGPARVKVAFYGAHKAAQRPGGAAERTSNTNVAYLASRREPVPMLTPSREEIAAVAKQFQNEVSAQLLSLSADAQDIRNLGQRVTRVQKRLAASALGRR